MDQVGENARDEHCLELIEAEEQLLVSFEDDPLEQLLNEFSEYEDLYEDDEDEDFDEDSQESSIYDSPSLFIDTSHKPSHEELTAYFYEKLHQLSEVGKRMRYYLDEIDLFMPNKKN